MSSDPLHNQPDKAGLHFEITQITTPAEEPDVAAPGPGDDRRAEPRAELQLLVEYTRLNKFFADYTQNLSHGGTFIRTDDPLPIGTECIFRMTVPRLSDPIVLRGQVMWTKRPGQKPDRLDPGPAGSWPHSKSDREARSAAVFDREARSAAVFDREARSAAVFDREARGAAVVEPPGMGIRFLYDSPEQRAAISETVEDLMIESLARNLYNKLMGRTK